MSRFTPEDVEASRARNNATRDRLDGPSYVSPQPGSQEQANYLLNRLKYRLSHPDGALKVEPNTIPTTGIDVIIDENSLDEKEIRLRDAIRDDYVIYNPPNNS